VGVLVLCTLTEVFLILTEVFLILTEVSPCFFLSCKANARAKLAKTGHGPHSSTLFVVCVVLLLFVLFYVLFVCKCVLPPGDNPNAVNKYIISSPPAALCSQIPSNLNAFLGAFTKLRKATISFMSVRLSVRKEQLGSQWMDFDEIGYLMIFRTFVEKIKFH
jgi:hypothetical protein